MCFETNQTGKTDKTILSSVKELFRAMMPLFNNQSKTVITPLLATGFQVKSFFFRTGNLLILLCSLFGKMIKSNYFQIANVNKWGYKVTFT